MTTVQVFCAIVLMLAGTAIGGAAAVVVVLRLGIEARRMLRTEKAREIAESRALMRIPQNEDWR